MYSINVIHRRKMLTSVKFHKYSHYDILFFFENTQKKEIIPFLAVLGASFIPLNDFWRKYGEIELNRIFVFTVEENSFSEFSLERLFELSEEFLIYNENQSFILEKETEISVKNESIAVFLPKIYFVVKQREKKIYVRIGELKVSLFLPKILGGIEKFFDLYTLKSVISLQRKMWKNFKVLKVGLKTFIYAPIEQALFSVEGKRLTIIPNISQFESILFSSIIALLFNRNRAFLTKILSQVKKTVIGKLPEEKSYKKIRKKIWETFSVEEG